MSRPLARTVIFAILLLPVVAPFAAAPPSEQGDAMVATDHVLASEAGVAILARGGNAVDGAVAAALAAGVVQPAGSGLGGGGFAIVADEAGLRTALDFREVAPAAAHRDLYRTEGGEVDSDASRTGGLAVAVPGESRGLARLLREHGRLTPAVVARPALALARRGFPVGAHLADALAQTAHEDVRRLFSAGARLPRQREHVRNVALARTLQQWARSGGEHLHEGAGARAIAARVREAGGILTEADLAAWQPVAREPLVGTYRGYTVVTMPPPSSGGVALLQLLGVLEGYDLQALGHNSSEYVHLLVEAMKHAYADRARHLGDPDFVEVPVDDLLAEERIGAIRRAIWPARTFEPAWYGELVEPPQDAGTQHISVVDPQGRAVALTTTINTSFGSGVVVPELGIVLNDEMDDFAAAPGVPNAYGLLGAEANAIEPGKRPLSSMTPTVVLDPDGRIVLAVGGSGGSYIITAVLQVVIDVIDFGMEPQEAVARPRFHHQWRPDRLYLEPAFPADVRRALEAVGHTVVERDGFSAVQLVRVEEDAMRGGADPRKGGWPAGIWLDEE